MANNNDSYVPQTVDYQADPSVVQSTSNDLSRAIDAATANLGLIGAQLQSNRNYESQKKFQRDVLRSQMVYQQHAYNQAQEDNSLLALAKQYERAGFNPRDALNRQGGANPMSAPSGMSAPQAPQFDFSPISAELQRRHDSRMDDVTRLLSASKMMESDSHSYALQKQAYKTMMDVMHDQKSLKLQDWQTQVKAYQIYASIAQKYEEMQKRYDYLDKQLKEQHDHNVVGEMTDLEFSLNNIGYLLDGARKFFDLDENGVLGKASRFLNGMGRNISKRRELNK